MYARIAWTIKSVHRDWNSPQFAAFFLLCALFCTVQIVWGFVLSSRLSHPFFPYVKMYNGGKRSWLYCTIRDGGITQRRLRTYCPEARTRRNGRALGWIKCNQRAGTKSRVWWMCSLSALLFLSQYWDEKKEKEVWFKKQQGKKWTEEELEGKERRGGRWSTGKF